MKLVTTVKNWIGIATHLYKKNRYFRALIIIQCALLICIAGSYTFFGTKHVTFAYSGPTCTKTLLLFPNSTKLNANADFTIEQKQKISIMGKALLAQELCISPRNAPSQNTIANIKLQLLGGPLFSKTIRIHVPKYPTLDKDLSSLRAVSVADPLALKLSSSDVVFQYVLHANDKRAVCEKAHGTDLTCDPTPLALQHTTKYTFSLSREFDKKTVQTLSTAQIETITPIIIKQTSIAPSSTRYDKPTLLQIVTDKQISFIKNASLQQKDGGQVPVKTSYSGTNLQIIFGADLARGKEFALTIDNILAQDGGSLIEPYVLYFSTSLGPKVASVNVPSSGADGSANMVIKFDQPIDTKPDNAKEVTLVMNGRTLGTRVTTTDTAITIDPSEVLPKCTRFTLNLSQNISNPYGIKGDSAWSYTARTTCFDVFSIGTSVQGRQIIAYRYGSGSNPLLFVGGMHGNEQNGKRLMDKWVDEVDASPEKIPVNRSIVIIPTTNPDGYANNQRVNARGIDLNRNFPANNWKASVKEPSGNILPEGGGATALSEPESSALASYVQSVHPVFVMSFHSSGGVAVANDAANSRVVGAAYAARSGYGSKNGDNIGTFFDYDTTGAFEDWLNDKQGTGAVLVELYSKYDDEFGRNKSALWNVTQSMSF